MQNEKDAYKEFFGYNKESRKIGNSVKRRQCGEVVRGEVYQLHTRTEHVEEPLWELRNLVLLEVELRDVRERGLYRAVLAQGDPLVGDLAQAVVPRLEHLQPLEVPQRPREPRDEVVLDAQVRQRDEVSDALRQLLEGVRVDAQALQRPPERPDVLGERGEPVVPQGEDPERGDRALGGYPDLRDVAVVGGELGEVREHEDLRGDLLDEVHAEDEDLEAREPPDVRGDRRDLVAREVQHP